MPSMLLVVFTVQLCIHALAIVGSEAINAVLWDLYSRAPTPQSGKAAANQQLRREVINLKSQMDNTSAQDDFAKWAKLRRQHDKKKDEYDKQARELQDFQSSFNRIAGIVKWVSTTGIRYALQWWFGKQAMFYLPKGWVPYAAEWILSFPSAPLGSVSINMWWISCASIISMVSEVISTAWRLRSDSATSKEKLAVPSKTAQQPRVVDVSEKKEL